MSGHAAETCDRLGYANLKSKGVKTDEKASSYSALKKIAYCLAMSEDRSRLAISSNREVQILSFPEMQLLQKLPICHVGSMLFLKNSDSLLTVSTTGDIFLWNGAETKQLGKWPTQFWREGPLFYCGSDCVALAYNDGVCLFDLHAGRFEEIYACPGREHWIAGCQDGKLRIPTIAYRKRWQNFGYAVVDLQGNVHSQCFSDRKLNGRRFSRPVLLDGGTIALLSSASPRCLFSGGNSLYTIDLGGHVAEYKTVPKTYSCCPCDAAAAFGRSLAFAHSALSHNGVTLYDAADGSFVGQISEAELRQGSDVNPPSCLLFLSEEKLLVGTWEGLFSYRMVPISQEF